MNDFMTAIVLAAALVATFGLAYCIAWFVLRTLMTLMPARKTEMEVAVVPNVSRFGIFRKLALGQKH